MAGGPPCHLGDGRWWDDEQGVWRDGSSRKVLRRRPLVGRGAPELARRPRPQDPLPCPGRGSSRCGRPRWCWRQRISTTTRPIAAGGTATSGHSASGATCCTTGPSIAGASGSPCAGAGPWATCSRASIRADQRYGCPLVGHPTVTHRAIPCPVEKLAQAMACSIAAMTSSPGSGVTSMSERNCSTDRAGRPMVPRATCSTH